MSPYNMSTQKGKSELVNNLIRICSGKELVHARRWGPCRDAAACWQIYLCRGSAREAPLLAPSKQACSLAIFEAVVSSRGVAITARIADAHLRCHATLEFGMINATKTQSLLAALVALVTEGVVVERLDCGLIIG